MTVFGGPGHMFGGLFRTALTNERLFLMGVTSLALSFASGWTTFEGMTNFTRSPVLCFLITFGVQGIMLVSAWMIGEAFSGSKRAIKGFTARLSNFVKVALICLVFIFAMAISVFFSFDSLFSSIFSDDERARAAEIRAISQVSGVLSNVETRIEKRKNENAEALIASPGWKEYTSRLDRLSDVARSAPDLVEQQLMSKMRSEQAEIARHQETLAQAKGQTAALRARQERINQAITRLGAERPALLAEVDQLRQAEREKQRLIDAKQAEAAKEARGIGQTGREGEGPKFRAIKEEQRRLDAELDVIKGQKTIAQGRLEALDRQIASQKQQLALINGDVAKIEGEASVAEKFITAQQQRQTEEIKQDLSATASIDSLDQSRDSFRQQPGEAAFLAIQQNCVNLLNALSAVPKIAPEIASISCEPGAATATDAGRIFALQAAKASHAKNCTLNSEAEGTSTDELLKLGQRCIQASGLPEEDATEFRAILSRINLNRDDKAKNFVVTLNAFSDGNWLAYLALCLAIAIDSLVFLSGLIGARTASYENTGSHSDVIKYGLGMSSTIYGFEPEDIYTRKIFFRSVCGPSTKEGYLAVIDTGNLQKEERDYVNKVLTIAGDKIQRDESSETLYHIEEKFYQNLARQVYLWDQFNSPKQNRRVLETRKKEYVKKQQQAEQSFRLSFGGKSPGAMLKKGGDRPAMFNPLPLTETETEAEDQSFQGSKAKETRGGEPQPTNDNQLSEKRAESETAEKPAEAAGQEVLADQDVLADQEVLADNENSPANLVRNYKAEQPEPSEKAEKAVVNADKKTGWLSSFTGRGRAAKKSSDDHSEE